MKDNPTKYFACSRNAGDWLFGRRVLASEQLIVLNNAVDIQEFAYDAQARKLIRNELQATGRLVIGHVGRFNEQKNHGFLIDVFKAIHDNNPKALLVLVGDGHLKPAMERKVASLGLSSQVRFLGIRNDIPKLMQGMDLFLFPSLFEGLPVVLVEAQASGLRCVATDTITSDANVTGRVDFMSLKETPEQWAQVVLNSSYEHEDTSELMRNGGYDTATMAHWLSDYYEAQFMERTSS
jgi:glycosyltransferase involved in cell wall biosynthesis